MSRKDYTDGLKFIPWLWDRRKGHLLGLFGNAGLGLGLLFYSLPDITGIIFGSFFGIIVPTIIGVALKRDYNDAKQGFSR